MQSDRPFDGIPNAPQVTEVEYTPVVSAICGVMHVPFQGRAIIRYSPNDLLLEFESFETWLKTISTTETTIEGLTRLIFDALRSVLGDIQLTVTVTATTAVHAPVSATIKGSPREQEV